MNFVDKGLSVDNGCFRYQSLFYRCVSIGIFLDIKHSIN